MEASLFCDVYVLVRAMQTSHVTIASSQGATFPSLPVCCSYRWLRILRHRIYCSFWLGVQLFPLLPPFHLIGFWVSEILFPLYK